ncbi:hypothetical protein B0H15DRAFT_1003506 [Mycena belliarum]|uniref:Uncharacterized protein n=1 Tax=Mycena belliarum TaxID=1033014 RepID=A0AAD6TV75_9AGAR|nr:hypothetical protein B0H15DRAFT_1003506 [Mycena belliae]
MSGSLTAPAVLSAGTPFTDLLRARAPATAGEGEHDSATPEKNGPAAGLQPAHEQNGLSKADAEGLKRVEPTLSANGGGIRSGEKNPGPLDPLGRLEAPAAIGPPLGPPSLKRAITRALTMPEGLGTSAPNPVTALASVNAATQDHDAQFAAAADDTHPGSPPPPISTADHYAFAVYSASEPGKAETATAMARRTTKNLNVLADATRITQSTLEKLGLALSQLTVETRLRADASRNDDHGNRSPSPPPSHHEYGDDIEELFDRVRDLEGQVTTAHVFGNAIDARVTTLERVAPAAAPGALTVAELSDLVGRRFGEITSDRDVLDNAIKFNADTHAEDLRDLRLENKDLRTTLAAMQVTITRLQTTVELASPAPLRARAASPRRRSIAPSSSHGPVPRTSRSRSPGRSIPAKRQRVEERKHQDRAREGFVIMGPLADSPLIPLQLFESLLATNLPAFALTKPYDAVVDPVHPYHIRVTLDSLKTARDLVDAWSVGNRSVRMRELSSQDMDLRTGFHDSHSRAPFQESVSHSGYHRRGRDSNNRGARGGFAPL